MKEDELKKQPKTVAISHATWRLLRDYCDASNTKIGGEVEKAIRDYVGMKGSYILISKNGSYTREDSRKGQQP